MREAKHEGIISKETYWRIQERLDGKPARGVRKDTNLEFPLRGGAVVCGSCGYALTGGWCTGKRKKYAYYFCHNRECSEKSRTIPVAKLDGVFEEHLKELRPSKPYLELVKAMFQKAWEMQAAHAMELTRAYQKKVRDLEAEIGKVVDRMLDVTNTRALKAFEDRIESLERQKLKAEMGAAKKPEALRPYQEMFEHSLRFLANPHECWKIGSAEARNLVVRLAFDGALSYDRKTNRLNTKKSSVFSVLESFCVENNRMVPRERIELSASPLPMVRSTTELPRPIVLLVKDGE